MIASPMDDRAKATWLCGLYAGLNALGIDRRALKAKIQPVKRTAVMVAFEGGAFNPLQIWEMLIVVDELMQEREWEQHS